MSRIGLILTFLTLCIFWAGCDAQSGSVVNETEEKHYQRGQRLLREGREGEALNAFLKVIDKRPDAPESHLEAGILYQQHIGDPVSSIYHLRRYIELRPDSDEAEKAQQLIETAKKDFARSLPGQPYDSAIERLDLLEMLEAVREENKQLKRELAAVRQGQVVQNGLSSPGSSSQGSSRVSYQSSSRPLERSSSTATSTSYTPPQQAHAETPSNTRSYTVVSGDTLTRISAKVYGEAGRWQDIFEANRDLLPNPNALRVGQTLKIPQ
ncbi:LysM peptidoglycan-binding domain-containing protein [Cerasicoccus maritimus]|uniref:LysM peptidoglycan-binding domain-containing protein n=1 Tax=Cerasicoccus maritimus TaxID=490089 RepID=UPI002852922B|nr:LysM peptidoglycan-binding domain-containing protein [Cerasicoccus maritimus]